MIEDVMSHTDFIMFKESFSDTAMSFRKKIKTHSKNDKIVIAEF